MTDVSAPLFGCVEAGGTKFVLGVARTPGEMLRTARISTTTPAETIAATLTFFEQAKESFGSFAAVGVASFGPVELDRAASNWGFITDTPKPGWSNTDLAGAIARALDCPVGFDTDVNGAILAESLWGAAGGADVAVYVTVGTGIGGGAVVAGQPIHGLRHPEMGHMLPRRHPLDRDFAGVCPFHGDCLEGLASGPAIQARWGAPLSELASDHAAHDVVAFYLAQLVVTQQALLSPCKIVLGGGVMNTPGLLDRVRTQSAQIGQGYFGKHRMDQIIVTPGLGQQAGLLGALALAYEELRLSPRV